MRRTEETNRQKITIGITSDTHGYHSITPVPKCDVFIHCGDFSIEGEEEETRSFGKWLQKVDATYKIIILGNHERTITRNLPANESWIKDHCPDCYFLRDEGVVIQDFYIYGSTYRFTPPKNFQVPEGKEFILVTHEPPREILDVMVVNQWHLPWKYFNGGSGLLRRWVDEHKPKLHCFGHCHHCYGVHETEDTLFINASRFTEIAIPWNSPRLVEYENGVFKLIK